MCIFLTEADPLDFECFSLLLLEQLMFTLEILEHLRSFVPGFAISSCQNGFSFLAEYSEAFFTLFPQSVLKSGMKPSVQVSVVFCCERVRENGLAGGENPWNELKMCCKKNLTQV